MNKLWRDYGFFVGLGLAVAGAFLAPGVGASGGLLHTEVTAKVGVVVIFLILGLVLPTESLWRGALDVRTHAFVLGFMFLVFPLGTWLFLAALPWALPPDLFLGFLFLAVLPTTISTSVAFSARAGGDVAAALFDVAFSNAAGVFIVPLAMTWVSRQASAVPLREVGGMLGEVALLILLPLAVGQALRPWAKGWAERRRRAFARTNSAVVLLLIFSMLCNSVQAQVWQKHGLGMVALTAGLVVVLFLGMNVLALVGIRVCRLPYEAGVAALVCGTQKTMAAGVPLAQAVFSGSAVDVGLLTLPLLMYSPLQLFLGGIVVAVIERHRGAREGGGERRCRGE